MLKVVLCCKIAVDCHFAAKTDGTPDHKSNSSCGGGLACAIGGASVGRPSPLRYLRTETGSITTATEFHGGADPIGSSRSGDVASYAEPVCEARLDCARRLGGDRRPRSSLNRFDRFASKHRRAAFPRLRPPRPAYLFQFNFQWLSTHS